MSVSRRTLRFSRAERRHSIYIARNHLKKHAIEASGCKRLFGLRSLPPLPPSIITQPFLQTNLPPHRLMYNPLQD
ncbi:MAG: hypothetical protein H0W99_06135 [Acidobacteria bacterium]|nr:hypothetical protein [Acidobacteriota bacterium]